MFCKSKREKTGETAWVFELLNTLVLVKDYLCLGNWIWLETTSAIVDIFSDKTEMF